VSSYVNWVVTYQLNAVMNVGVWLYWKVASAFLFFGECVNVMCFVIVIFVYLRLLFFFFLFGVESHL